MIDDKADSLAGANALKALVLAVGGLILGRLAFELHLHGGDEKFFTYSVGLACSGCYMGSIAKLAKALRATSPAQPGAPGTVRIMFTAIVVTLAGIPIFTFSGVLANHMMTFENPSGVETLVGLIVSLLSFVGPVILGVAYFYWMQQSLCDSGWNIIAALIVALLCAGISIYVWYALNVQYGPRILRLFTS